MDHLPFPESTRAHVLEIPHLGLAPAYDRQGFDGFLERIGTSRHRFLTDVSAWSKDPFRGTVLSDHERRKLNSLLQEWCWFGLLHEFETSCDIPIDPHTIVNHGQKHFRVLDTSFLPAYVRSAFELKLRKSPIPLDLKVGDVVYTRRPKDCPNQLKVIADRGRFIFTVQDMVTEEIVDMRASRLMRNKTEQSDVTPKGLEQIASDKRLAGTADDMYELMYDFAVCTKSKLLLPYLRSTAISSLSRCANDVCTIVRALNAIDSDFIIHEIWASLDVLIDSLGKVALRLQGKPFNLFYDTHSGQFLHPWCPSRIGQFPNTSAGNLYEIARLLSPHDSRDHTECLQTSCRYAANPTMAIKPLHSQECEESRCKNIYIDENTLFSIIEDGGSPCLLPTNKDNDDAFMVADTRDVSYVAISHVWSHGLGNALENALPLCQVKKLFALIQKYVDISAGLWVDSLSVPTEILHKKQAMARMRDVYQKAVAVVVIDRHLEQVGPDPLERSLQILSSEWVTRLWTYQEGRVATKLMFSFKDGMIPIDGLSDSNKFSQDNAIFVDFGHTLDAALKPLVTGADDTMGRFAELTYGLAQRRGTVSSDEPVVVANLLGLNWENFQDQVTMADVYKAYPNDIPTALLFEPTPRLEERGLRWAPATLMHKWAPLKIVYEGCHLTKRGLNITCKWISIASPFDLKLEARRPWRYLIDPVENGEASAFHTFLEQPETLSRRIKKAAILLRKAGSYLTGHSKGVIVSIEDPPEDEAADADGTEMSNSNNSVIFCRYVALVFMAQGEWIAEAEHGWAGYLQGTIHTRGEFHESGTFCVD